METMIGGHVVARALKQHGTSCVFTLCGGHVAPIYDGCLREGIDIADVRHEQAAATPRTPGRASPGDRESHRDGRPRRDRRGDGRRQRPARPTRLVVIGGAAELRVRGRGALQEMDQLPLMRPVTKWAASVTDPGRLAEYVRTAFRQATSSSWGRSSSRCRSTCSPPDRRAEVRAAGRTAAARARRRGAVAAAARRLATARRPVVFAGSQVWWDDAAGALRDLANARGSRC